ncbi:MAG: NAD+ synthase [Phycisphaerales bacterium]|nr:NAD+ synthase [Phycisphaerales bacterium]
MKIALAQLNPTVGDLAGNTSKIIDAINAAREQGAKLVVFSELVICGYPPRDLLHVEGFVEECAAMVNSIGENHTKDISIIIGTPLPVDTQEGVSNSLVVYTNNKYITYYDKRLLPTYDVFDEDRYFAAGDEYCVVLIGDLKVGLAICEDLWQGDDSGFSSRYASDTNPVAELIAHGAQIIIAPSASPFVLGKEHKHIDILAAHAREHTVPVVSVNQVGANDDLIFSGQSVVVDQQGKVCAQCKRFDEGLIVFDTEQLSPTEHSPMDDEHIIIDALTLGIHDYVNKCGFKKVCLGLSGGIDSAIVAALAVRALGKDNVLGVSMPGKFSSDHSKTDAFDLAANMGMNCITMPIETGFAGVCESLNPAFDQINQPKLGESLPDITQENLQSRIRGTMMMALSNRTGALVLTTGNKSEIAVGYCTLYGDMNGGLAVIADIPKTMVFKVCRYMNEHYKALGYDSPPIPANTIEKPPSAELAPNQLDSDSLPDYTILDEIIQRHIEGHQNASRIIEETSFDADTVNRICKLIDRNEYKRQQMAVGLKVTTKAFGPGRRMPIAHRWTR